MAVAVGIDPSTLHRFERGAGWRRDIERIVETYEQECALPQGTLWRRALDLDWPDQDT